MPLPGNGVAWPPHELANITPSLQQWSAWYDGSPEALRAAYTRGGFVAAGVGPTLLQTRLNQHGGIRGVLQRMWWGRPITDITQLQRDMLHIPIAADICQASADLLFADPPTFTIDSSDTATQDRLEELCDDGMYPTLAEAAEVAAALGGVYLRVTWDRELNPGGPFTTMVHADAAWPEFQWGKLRAVTFWSVVHVDGATVWRHLERHELDPSGVGIILHGLYQGGLDSLGQQVPLGDQPATAVFADQVDADGAISTLTPGLAVTYIPNQRPQRRWRNDPVGASLGRSDLDGIEGLMDALDETYSSWMRDIRLGKARILIAKSMLDNLGPGQGMHFNAEQEAYAAVNMLQATSAGGTVNMPIEQIQFKIRVQEHKETAQQLVEDILRTAGYSTQTFGEGDTGNIRTATEVEQRERRSLLTRDRKIRLYRPRLQNHTEKLLHVDQAVFGTKITPARPEVEFAAAVQETPLAIAQTVQALYAADAASTEVRVAMVHPDWDDDDVQAEVAKITAEQQAQAVPDPMFTQPGGTPDAGVPSDAAGQQRY